MRILLPRSSGYCHAIFDLDGTLVDSATEIHAAACATCSEFDLKLPSLSYIQRSTGRHPSEFFIEHGAKDDELTTECVAFFRRHLVQNGGDPRLVMPGVDDLLRNLTQVGVLISCATTKPTSLAVELLGRYKLKQYFWHIQGTDSSMSCKPAPDVVEACLKNAQGLSALMVGDTVLDIQAARAAGIDSAAVASGADTFERLGQAGPTHLFPHISHVGDLFQF
jgi:phosphoglycolate phosphatase